MCRLIVLPFVWVRSVVHSYSKVLCAREEEVPVVGELTRITSSIVVDDGIGGRLGYEILRYDFVGIPLFPGGSQAKLSHHGSVCQLLLAAVRTLPALIYTKGAGFHELLTFFARYFGIS